MKKISAALFLLILLAGCAPVQAPLAVPAPATAETAETAEDEPQQDGGDPAPLPTVVAAPVARPYNEYIDLPTPYMTYSDDQLPPY